MLISRAGSPNQRVSRLRVRHLQALELLSQLGSMRKVAERLHLSQPAVSQMVKEIEEAFEGPLLTRSRKRVVPNGRMELLLRRIRAILGEVEAASSELARTSMQRPVVRIGANFHLLTLVLPPAITVLRSLHPELRFVLQEGAVDALYQMIADGALDCAVCRVSSRGAGSSGNDEFSVFPLYEAALCVVVSRNHPLYKRRAIRLKDLVGEDWALSAPEGRSRQLLADAFIRAGLPVPEPVIECRPFAVNLAIAAELPLVTVGMREGSKRGRGKSVFRVLPLRLEQNSTPVAFVCRKTKMNVFPLPAVRNAVIASARSAGLPPPHYAKADHEG